MIARRTFQHCAFIIFVGFFISTQSTRAITTELHTSSSFPRKGVTLVKLPPPKKNEAPTKVGLYETIELQVDYLADCIKEIRGQAVEAANAQAADAQNAAEVRADDALIKREIANIVLFINGSPMRTIHVLSWLKDKPEWHPEMTDEEKKIPRHYLRFVLSRDASNDSKEDWDRVLRPQADPWTPLLDVGAGLYNGNTADELPNWVGAENDSRPELEIRLLRIPVDVWLVTGLILLGAALAGFIYCAAYTGIVRDPTLPVREDGLAPVSLGRCQMAFWFFLVAAAFFFLWLITGRGDLNTINGQVLSLIGISAGTAIGAAVLQANPPPGSVKTQQTGEPFPEQIATASKNLSAAIEAQAAEEQVKEAEKTISELKLTYDLWRRQNRYRFLFDLLSEPDDKGRHVIAFPRFQIVVWTLVLGVIFVSDVITKLAMPAFDSNLLVFMSISSGTYLGFKLPPAKKQ